MTAVRSAASSRAAGLFVTAGVRVAVALTAPVQDKRSAMRDFEPEAIRVPPGYAVEPFATKPTSPWMWRSA